MTEKLALGIDAGGTFTDLVLLDQETGQIVSRFKSPTTRPDPSKGVATGLLALDAALLDQVRMVSLATTFATNAIVEEVGGEAGLILIGYDEPPGVIPREAGILMLEGGHNVSGNEKCPLDLGKLDKELDSFVYGLDAVAVAGFFSVRNPDHEQRVADEIRRRYDLPVVRGHRLSLRLDAYKRATTAWWNARLIPLLSDLIHACRRVLADRRISAPFMVVRGDGTLMSADTALDRPVDTILSGPAASILGAKHLAGVDDCLIVDMGGTTTDMAVLANGRVAIDPDGARVGKWETHVEAARVRTIGLGGDSLINANGNKSITVGPRRVIPLCVQAQRTPAILDLLRAVQNRIGNTSCKGINPSSFYLTGSGSPRELESLSGLEPRILSEFFVWCDDKAWTRSMDLAAQEKRGRYIRTALTPTDLRVAAGQFSLGKVEAARLGRSIFARHMGLTEKELFLIVEDTISQILCTEAVAFISGEQRQLFYDLAPRWYRLPDSKRNGLDLELKLILTAPVVGVGAPAPSCLPETFAHLNTQSILPQGYDVSVAVGAMVGMVDRTFTGIIRPNSAGKVDLHTVLGKETLSTIPEAIETGRRKLEYLAETEMKNNYVSHPLFEFKVSEKRVPSGQGEAALHLQTDLFVRATGRPNVSETKEPNAPS